MLAYVCPETLTKVVQDMKICPRYPPPKSSSSGGGLGRFAPKVVLYVIPCMSGQTHRQQIY